MNGQKRVAEGVAKRILQEHFPDRYFNLENLDAPDLQDREHSIGIEVVTLQKASKAAKINYKHMSKSHKYEEKIIKRYDTYLGNGSLTEEAECRETVIWHMFCEFNKKVAKLQKYAEFSCYELFVLANDLCRDEFIDGECLKIVTKNCIRYNTLQRKFSKVFLAGHNILYKIDLTSDLDTVVIELHKKITSYFDEMREQLHEQSTENRSV